ncbi:MAG: flagellar hook-basal body complex protein FliE [bacterium]|nr:flagellar hook-basal body complex protein FliE [bacterium]
MSPINPIQGPIPSMPSTPTTMGAGQQSNAVGKGSFAGKLKSIIGQIDQTEQASSATVENLLSGKTQDIIPTITAAAKADMSFKLLIGVRNKVIEAYKQTMNMQI